MDTKTARHSENASMPITLALIRFQPSQMNVWWDYGHISGVGFNQMIRLAGRLAQQANIIHNSLEYRFRYKVPQIIIHKVWDKNVILCIRRFKISSPASVKNGTIVLLLITVIL